jgi:seryl-tRNA synthetase
MKDRFMDPSSLDEIYLLHKSYTDSLLKADKIRKLKNIISNSINKPKQGDKIEFDFENEHIDPEQILEKNPNTNYSKQSLIRLGKDLKPLLEEVEKQVDLCFKQRNELVGKVPIFDDEENNQIIRKTLTVDPTGPEGLDQYQLCCKLGIIEEAGEIAGHRGYFLVNEGVRLNYALINYALDFLQQRNYKLMYVPHFMKKEKMEQVCQLSDFQETLYDVNGGELFLIATSEQPMTSYFADKQINNLKENPVRLCEISSCYRKEAGKHGKDTLGIFRVHQFEKVEQFCVTTPDQSWAMMEEMINTSEEFYKSLGIDYKVVNIVSKKLNNAAAMKYDLEGYFKGSGKYRELVSCSNTTDYFSRKIRVKAGNKEFAHMLNSTLFANTRTICCLLETHQCEDGVRVPNVLKKYYGVDKILFKN